jgi:hypothetical protein
MAHSQENDLPVISDLTDFDFSSGGFLEQLVFNNRAVVVVLCLLTTVVLGYQASKIQLQAGFDKMLPKHHEYVVNYFENRDYLAGLGNNLRLSIETTGETIYEADFLEIAEAINQEVFFTPGVDRIGMKSIFTPNTRWKIVTEDGFEGGSVIPRHFDRSPDKIEELKLNITRAGIVGDLVANNATSITLIIPLMDKIPETGERLDYYAISKQLEDLRQRYEAEGGVKIHITGFAKIVGDLIDGMQAVMIFFLIAVIIAALLLYWYTRCARSTFVVIFCTLVAIAWQLGILATMGYELDPYSILVPFLVFAIGVSHGAQKLNGVLQDIGRGTHRYIAARYTFRRLFLAGVTALLSDGVGFAVLMIITIPVIQDLAVTASVGVLVLIFTNLILVPVVLSYLGVGRKCTEHHQLHQVNCIEDAHWLWRFLLAFTERKWAALAIALGVVMAVVGLVVSKDLQIGDLDPGAPELRPNSQYNQDIAYMNANYSTSSDIFAIIVKSEADGCIDHEALSLANELEARLLELDGVEGIRGLNTGVRRYMSGMNEGYIKWEALFRNQDTINFAVTELMPLGYVDVDCSLWPMIIYLSDHKAATLMQVVELLEGFGEEFETDKVTFLGAAGSAGFEAATNIVVEKANREMLFYVYGAVIALCLLTFRSIPGVICAVLPLMLTSILCEALMVWLGIGVKVATLPVIALGVGIGVDYALYVLTVILAKERQGIPLKQAYFETLMFTGRVVALIGVTLAAGVATWVFSPIKFQADMGILLTFMFLWNMVGALILMPALAHFLLKPAPVGEGEGERPGVDENQ